MSTLHSCPKCGHAMEEPTTMLLPTREQLIAQLQETKDKLETAEKALAVVCERAVVDFDDATVGIVNKAVGPASTYGDFLRGVYSRAEKCVAFEADNKRLREAIIPIICNTEFLPEREKQNRIDALRRAFNGV